MTISRCRHFLVQSLALILTGLFVSCSGSKKIQGTKTAAEEMLPALPASEIDIPVKISGRTILKRLEESTPKEFNSPAWPDYLQTGCDFRYKYRFVRSELALTCVNNNIGVQFTGSYQVAGSRCLCSGGRPVSPWISGSCGFGKEPMRRTLIHISSRFHFLPGYQLQSKTTLDLLSAPDKCFVSILSSDITQQILDSVRSSVKLFCSSIDETVQGFDMSSTRKQITQLGFNKISIGGYGYLLINPIAVRVGNLNYAKDSFRLSAGLGCRPLLTSDSTQAPLPQALPPLQQTENKAGISLYLNAVYDYAFISRLLNDSLKNKVFEVKGRTIVIKEVTLKGIGHRQIELRIDFAGTNKGSIFLRGTPLLDSSKQTVSIPDIGFSLESGDLAIKIARSLFRNKIRKSLEGSSYLDLAAMVKSNLASLDASLNRQLTKGIYSVGKIREISMLGLLPRTDALQVQLHVAADLSLLSDGVF